MINDAVKLEFLKASKHKPAWVEFNTAQFVHALLDVGYLEHPHTQQKQDNGSHKIIFPITANNSFLEHLYWYVLLEETHGVCIYLLGTFITF